MTQGFAKPYGSATTSPPSSGRGIIGWLRGIYDKVKPLPAPVFTQVAVTTGEVAVPAANKAGRATVTIKALAANGAAVYLGLTGVSTTTGFELSAGDSIDIDADDTVNLKAVSASGTQRVSVAEI